jgi:hypothetical protein
MTWQTRNSPQTVPAVRDAPEPVGPTGREAAGAGLATVLRTRRVRDVEWERKLTLQKATDLIWLTTGILEAAFALRFVLKLIGANAANAFASLVYSATDLFLGPFLSLVAMPQAGAMILEVPTMFAMAVYGLAAWVVVRSLWVIFDKPQPPPA